MCTPQLKSLKPIFPLLIFLLFRWVHQEPSPVWAEKNKNFCKGMPVISAAAFSHFQPSSNQLMVPLCHQLSYLFPGREVHLITLTWHKIFCMLYNCLQKRVPVPLVTRRHSSALHSLSAILHGIKSRKEVVHLCCLPNA